MENLQRIYAAVIGALFTPMFQYFYGEGEIVKNIMVTVAFFIFLDWISGIRASKKDKSYASKYGLDGVFRTFLILLLPAGGHLLDKAIMLPGVVFGLLSAGVLYHVLQSMTANAVRAGWCDWIPINILNKIVEWVGSEIDSKISRAEKRIKDKGVDQ